MNSTTTSSVEPTVLNAIRNLMENTSDMIYFKDLNSVFTLCSDSLTRHLTGGLEQSLVGKSDFDFFDPECAQVFFDGEQEIIRTGKPLVGLVETEVRNGKTSWVFTSKLPLRDKDGNIIGTFGISRDVTEQKLTELKLQETNRQLMETSRRAGKAEIATNVIHNVGNVLTSLKVAIAQSEKLNAKMPLEKIEKVADLIEQNCNEENFFAEGHRGSHIPEYLRDLNQKYKADRDQLKRELAETRRHLDHISNIVAQQQRHACGSKVIEKIDLSELISDALQMSRDSLDRNSIEVVCDFDAGLVVETDKHQVLQIIINLIRNAKHACLESGNSSHLITVSVTKDAGDQFSISVADNGVGIEKANFAKLFTFGFSTRESGSGFGLHSSANTAKELGGSLEVQSEGRGKGATFVLTLPGKLN